MSKATIVETESEAIEALGHIFHYMNCQASAQGDYSKANVYSNMAFICRCSTTALQVLASIEIDKKELQYEKADATSLIHAEAVQMVKLVLGTGMEKLVPIRRKDAGPTPVVKIMLTAGM